MKPESISLSQLNMRIKSAVSDAFEEPVWIVAEISESRVNISGHCYMELIEKASGSDQILARIKATIWSFTYRMLAPYFETSTGYRLDAGIKVLIRVIPEFHEVYGISLIIKDIDPSYTLGDLALRKQEILKRLQAEGVIDMNRMLPFPLVPQRIAVISSETAAGYGDFADSLRFNSHGYFFRFELFSAQVQGEKASESVINALERIYEREEEFDVVVIIRGGGAQSELDCFNNYDLVYHITQFPLPVISGIGHERDETITDLVAHTSVKTPTAAAELFIDSLHEFESLLESYSAEIAEIAGNRITDEKNRVFSLSRELIYLVNTVLSGERSILSTQFSRLGLFSRQVTGRKSEILKNLTDKLRFHSLGLITREQRVIENTFSRLHKETGIYFKSREIQLSVYERNLEHLSPEKVLMRGYSITSSGKKLIVDSAGLKEGDELVTRFYKGKAVSIVKKTSQ